VTDAGGRAATRTAALFSRVRLEALRVGERAEQPRRTDSTTVRLTYPVCVDGVGLRYQPLLKRSVPGRLAIDRRAPNGGVGVVQPSMKANTSMCVRPGLARGLAMQRTSLEVIRHGKRRTCSVALLRTGTLGQALSKLPSLSGKGTLRHWRAAKNGNLVVQVDVPGVDPKDIDMSVVRSS
jgi:hypothetical protein